MRNRFFYTITSYAEFRISVIPNQRNDTELLNVTEFLPLITVITDVGIPHNYAVLA